RCGGPRREAGGGDHGPDPRPAGAWYAGGRARTGHPLRRRGDSRVRGRRGLAVCLPGGLAVRRSGERFVLVRTGRVPPGAGVPRPGPAAPAIRRAAPGRRAPPARNRDAPLTGRHTALLTGECRLPGEYGCCPPGRPTRGGRVPRGGGRPPGGVLRRLTPGGEVPPGQACFPREGVVRRAGDVPSGHVRVRA